MSSEDKIRKGAQPFLDDGEHVIAAFLARPHGLSQSRGGRWTRGQGKSRLRIARQAAELAHFPLASSMALAITPTRLLSLSMGVQVGMGVGGGVKGLVGQARLSEVESISIKRYPFVFAQIVTVTLRGHSFKLEVGAGANTKGVVDAFNNARPS